MCSNFQALREIERMERYFRIHGELPDFPRETWPVYVAPYIRRDLDSPKYDFAREARMGHFGMVPSWAKGINYGRRTYNSRSETSSSLVSFKNAWARGQRAIIPAEWIYEPFYPEGQDKPIRWKIQHVDDAPLGIAGLWEWCPKLKAESFTMLTVNADGHPLMQRFHAPDDEKRMVVILDPADYDRWLDCPVPEMMSMMTRYPAELLTAEPAPAPPRKKKAVIEDDQPPLI